MQNVMHYAKAIFAVLMAGLASALTFATEGSPEFMWLTITIAALTPVGVYLIPNAPKRDDTAETRGGIHTY